MNKLEKKIFIEMSEQDRNELLYNLIQNCPEVVNCLFKEVFVDDIIMEKFKEKNSIMDSIKWYRNTHNASLKKSKLRVECILKQNGYHEVQNKWTKIK